MQRAAGTDQHHPPPTTHPPRPGLYSAHRTAYPLQGRLGDSGDTVDVSTVQVGTDSHLMHAHNCWYSPPGSMNHVCTTSPCLPSPCMLIAALQILPTIGTPTYLLVLLVPRRTSWA